MKCSEAQILSFGEATFYSFVFLIIPVSSHLSSIGLFIRLSFNASPTDLFSSDSALLCPSHLPIDNPCCPAHCKFLWYSPNRTPELMTPVSKSSTQNSEPSSLIRKSTYPCPPSYCLKLSTVFSPIIDVSVLSWNYRKHIAQTVALQCICYITFHSSISRVPKAHILHYRSNRVVICLIYPINRFSPTFCATCYIFIVHGGCSANCDAFGAFVREEDTGCGKHQL